MVQIFVFNIVLMIKLFKTDSVRYEKSSNIVQNNSSIRNERHDPLLLERTWNSKSPSAEIFLLQFDDTCQNNETFHYDENKQKSNQSRKICASQKLPRINLIINKE